MITLLRAYAFSPLLITDLKKLKYPLLQSGPLLFVAVFHLLLPWLSCSMLVILKGFSWVLRFFFGNELYVILQLMLRYVF